MPTKRKSRTYIKTEQLIRHFGGPSELHSLLRIHIPGLEASTVWHWPRRGLPPHIFMLLMALRKKGEIAFDPEQFIDITPLVQA